MKFNFININKKKEKDLEIGETNSIDDSSYRSRNYSFSSSIDYFKTEKCYICNCDCSNNTEIDLILKCGHKFHIDCLNNIDNCVICKKNFDITEQIYIKMNLYKNNLSNINEIKNRINKKQEEIEKIEKEMNKLIFEKQDLIKVEDNLEIIKHELRENILYKNNSLFE